MSTATDLRTSKTAKKVILLYWRTLTITRVLDKNMAQSNANSD